MESCGDVSWEDILDNPVDLSDCGPDSCAHVRVVLDVIDVLLSPSSEVTELCYVSPCCSDRNLWNRRLFLSPKSVHIVGTDAQEEMTKAHQ